MKISAARPLAALVLPLALGCVSCSSAQLQAGGEPASELSKYRTYAWIPSEKAVPTPLENAIKSAVKRELARKGLAPARSSAQADVLLSYYAVSKNGESFGATPGPFRWGPSEEAVSVKEGSLTLEFIDPHSERDVWQGTATDTVDTKPDQKKIADAVKDLIQKYPSS